MRRVHPATRASIGTTDDDRRKELEDEVLRMKETVSELKQNRNDLMEENREIHLQHKKVLDIVRGEKVAALENIPAEFLTKDRGTEEYIKQLQSRVGELQRSSRKLTDSNEKLKEKVKTASRGTVPSRFLGVRKIHTQSSVGRTTSSRSSQPLQSQPSQRRTGSFNNTKDSNDTADTKPQQSPVADVGLSPRSPHDLLQPSVMHQRVGPSPPGSVSDAADRQRVPPLHLSPRGDTLGQSVEFQQVNSPNWGPLSMASGLSPMRTDTTFRDKKSVSFHDAVRGGASRSTAWTGVPSGVPVEGEDSRRTVLRSQPPSAQHIMSAPITAPTPGQPSVGAAQQHSLAAAALVAGQQEVPRAAQQIDPREVEVMLAQSDQTISDKTNVIFHLESLVVGLKEKLEASEALLLEMQDEVLRYKVERDESVKSRDFSVREKDVLVEERDYAVRAKAKLESDIIVQHDEIEMLKKDRGRLRDDLEAVTQRHRSERSRSDKLENQQLGAFEELQQTLKEKTAALIVLDQKNREHEQKVRSLHSANIEMLEEMQRINAFLNKERVDSREKDAALERLKLEMEGHEARDEQHRQLREEYVVLQQEHTGTLDKILATRNATEADARREARDEIAVLKQTISKWEAASKTQFKQYQSMLLRLEEATEHANSLEAKLREAADGKAHVEAECEQLRNTLKLLSIYKKEVEGEGQEALDEDRVSEIVMAMEIVQRARGVRTMQDMVRQFTGEEREDALVQLQQANEQLHRDVVVLHKANKQLKLRVAAADDDARRQSSVAAIRARAGEEHMREQQADAHRVIKVQTERIENLKKSLHSVVRYGGATGHPPSPGAASRLSTPSIGSSLSLASEVGPHDNILQVSFRLAHFVSETSVRALFGGGAEQAPPSARSTLDFFDFETVTTQEHFLQCGDVEGRPYFLPFPVDFDSHFVFKITESESLLEYISKNGCPVRLHTGGVGGSAEESARAPLAEGALSLAGLLSSPDRQFSQGKVALHSPTAQRGHTPPVVAYLDVVVQLKRPFSFASVPNVAQRFPVDAFALAEVDALANVVSSAAEAAVPVPPSLPVQLLVSCQEKLRSVAALRITLSNVALSVEVKCTIFTSFHSADVWFTQLEAEATRQPTFAVEGTGPAEKLVPVAPTAAPVLEALYEGALPFVLFDDSQADVTDCVGSASLATRPLLEGPPDAAAVRAPISFVNSKAETVGTAEVVLSWVCSAGGEGGGTGSPERASAAEPAS